MTYRDYLTEAEVSAYLAERGIARDKRTLQNQRTRGGGIPFVRIGRDIRYKKATVDRWLAGHREQASTSDIK